MCVLFHLIEQAFRCRFPLSVKRKMGDRKLRCTVTGRSSTPVDGGDGLLQTVEIRMFNKHQARERTIIDEQYWKYDLEMERWQLHSGLPDPTQGR